MQSSDTRRLAPSRAPATPALRRGMTPRPRIDFALGASQASLPGGVPGVAPPADGAGLHGIDEDIRFLVNRATNGFTVADYLEAKSMGYREWLDWQLDYENIDDSAVDAQLANFTTLTMTNRQLYEGFPDDPSPIVFELQQAVLLRQVFSRKQLYERMVEFWSDHFNIDQRDDLCLWFKTTDDRFVIRNHALGTFPEMLRRSARSAAMLWYLDNYANVAGAAQENYARELLELHTFGVNGPYTEQDVREVARCFTGWTFHGVFTAGPFGLFTYINDLHDQGAKTVLGQPIAPNGGQSDGEFVLDYLAMHPQTAEFITRKMARWLLGYNPPEAVIQRVINIYLSTGGSIKPMVRELLSPQSITRIADDERPKLRRPLDLLTSLMRATGTQSTNLLNLTIELQRMGQVPFWWPTPDGYPDSLDRWGNSLLPRWEYISRLMGYDIIGNIPDIATLQGLLATAPAGSTQAEAIDWVLTGGTMDPADVAEVQAFIDLGLAANPNVTMREAFALAASSPSYQYY